MLAQVRAQVREQVPPEAIRGECDFLKVFGFIPDDFDYEAGVYRLIQSQLAGYYDPDRQLMFLMDDLSENDRESTLAHELVHALQDQYFILGPKLRFEPDGNDHQAAIQSLAEGDATSAMLDYMAAPGQSPMDVPEDRLRELMLATVASAPDLAAFPYVLRASLIAPYVDGVVMVHRLRERGGWDAVDAVWRHLPASSEQVLHLEKLDAREPPETVSVPTCSTLGRQWSVTHTDVYGEQGLRISLEDWMPARTAQEAARGWAGDRAAVFRQPDGDPAARVGAWHIRFDPRPPPERVDGEAAEAFSAISSAWGVSSASSAACRLLPSGRRMAMVRSGRDIAIVAGPLPVRPTNGPTVSACTLELAWAAEVAADRS